MINSIKSNDTVMFTTAFAPFGNGEVFTLNEILDLKSNNVEIIVVPRSYGKTFVHEQGKLLITNTLNFRLLDTKTVFVMILWLFTNPVKLISIILWCWKWSWNLIEFLKTLMILPKALRIAKEVKSKNITHIHSSNTNTMVIVAYIASQVLNIPWSFSLHSWWPCLEKRINNFEVMIESAKFCRVISEHACNKLKKNISIRLHEKCIPIHIGVKAATKPCAKLPSNGIFTIVTPAVLQSHKGQHVAIEAGYLLVNMGVTNFKWIFYGDGAERSNLEKKIREYALDQFFELPGFIDNEELLHKYESGLVHVVALPSIELTGRPEGIPHALIQAAGYGIPLVSTDSGGTLELTGDGVGIVALQNDPQSLADSINKLISNNVYYIDQSIKAWCKASSDFNSDVNCHKLYSLF